MTDNTTKPMNILANNLRSHSEVTAIMPPSIIAEILVSAADEIDRLNTITPAKIEAAAQSVRDVFDHGDFTDFEEIATAALKAAGDIS